MLELTIVIYVANLLLFYLAARAVERNGSFLRYGKWYWIGGPIVNVIVFPHIITNELYRNISKEIVLFHGNRHLPIELWVVLLALIVGLIVGLPPALIILKRFYQASQFTLVIVILVALFSALSTLVI